MAVYEFFYTGLSSLFNNKVLGQGYYLRKMKKALIQLHVAVFLAGFTAILGKLITLNEGLLVWFRLFITAIILGTMLFFKKQLVSIPYKDLLKIFGTGTIVALHWVTFYASVKYANVSVALVCFSASGFFTAFFEPLLTKANISFVELGLGLLAIAGIYIIFDFHPQYTMGIIFGMVSAVGSAIFPIFNKKLLLTYTPKMLTFYELGGGLLALTVLVPVYLLFFPASYYIPTANDWMLLLVLAWLCTVISFELQLSALKKVSAFTASLTYNLEPVYGILIAIVFFRENENLKPAFYIGVVLILLAVVLQMLRIRKNYKRA